MRPEQRQTIVTSAVFTACAKWFDEGHSAGEIADVADAVLARSQVNDRLLGITKAEIIDVLSDELARKTLRPTSAALRQLNR